MNEIPIKNIYYMILYAWDKVKNNKKISELSLEKMDDFNKVILELFLSEVVQRAKKGLYGEYIEDNHNTKLVKGKINIKDSIYLTKPNIICNYDEFSQNNLLNQILKTVLGRIYRLNNVKKKLKQKLDYWHWSSQMSRMLSYKMIYLIE